MTKPDKKSKFNPQDVIEDQVRTIDEKIEALERRMRPYEELNTAKQTLVNARKALLGGNRITGGNSSRLSLEDVLNYVKENKGCSAGQIAQHFSVPQTTVSSHLYRNKARFVSKDGRYWVRDPEDGLDTAEDLEEDDE